MTKPLDQVPIVAAPIEDRQYQYIALDEEGYFLMDGLRVSDAEVGAGWLTSLQMDENGRAFFYDQSVKQNDRVTVLVEAFDVPLVANDLDPRDWRVQLPYGVTKLIDPTSLRVDEWDRFHFRTTEGVPGVLNKSAQSRFFQQAQDYDDESVTIDGQRWEIDSLYAEQIVNHDAAWWSSRYEEAAIPWDLGREHPDLETLIPPLKISRCRVLLLGCGLGHDAAWWSHRGHIVTAVDFSDSALSRARQLHGESATLRWMKNDALEMPKEMNGNFDVIFEHGLFCAVPPNQRQQLTRSWWRLLSPRGRVLGILPVDDKLVGPPYGASEWEIRKRLLESQRATRALFRPLIWKRLRESKSLRHSNELYFAVERNDSLD